MKTILLIVKIILLIVGIETGYAEAAEFSCKRVQFSCKRVQRRTCSGYAERSRKCQEIYTNFLVLFINGDLVGRTNHTNFRASERNQVLLELPSAAENVK